LHPAITWRRHKALHWTFFGLRILWTSTAASAGRCTLRTRRFACRWRASAWASGTRSAKATGTRWSKSWPCTESWPCSGTAGATWAAGSGVAARSGARGMLGARASGELAGRWGASRRALGIAAGTAGGTAIEDWLAALNAGRSGGLVASACLRDGRS
jgi:hypothetical protein